jgi:hypothetical protein
MVSALGFGEKVEDLSAEKPEIVDGSHSSVAKQVS